MSDTTPTTDTPEARRLAMLGLWGATLEGLKARLEGDEADSSVEGTAGAINCGGERSAGSAATSRADSRLMSTTYVSIPSAQLAVAILLVVIIGLPPCRQLLELDPTIQRTVSKPASGESSPEV